jgi:MEMO1 family protein
MKIRQAFFARQGWYPADESTCRRVIDEYLAAFPGSPSGTRAGVVPHAGWIYSGRTAAMTFAALSDCKPQVVFVFGGHMHPGERCVCMPRDAFETPLGELPVDEQLAADLVSRFNCYTESSDDFQPDNTIELQLPFIKAVWPTARVVAVQVPPDDTAAEMGAWAAGESRARSIDAVAIGSTDLTHYGPNYGFQPQGSGEKAHAWSKEKNDRPFIDKLLVADWRGAVEHALANHSACCPGAAAAAVSFAREMGIETGKLLEHTTSHEIEGRGSPGMWVGYAAIVY